MDPFAEFMDDFRQTLAATPKEELAKLWADVKGLQIGGPTVGDVLTQPDFFTIEPKKRPLFPDTERAGLTYVYYEGDLLQAA